ncbi:MAG: CHAT domain-containing protein [Coleofasciculus sp. G1-WW12-02]|uniref:CHAT domain-containing protein n=1 Tax=Coleofasciculus sp. G1-WW12-02 TaxID=3068483 RepID=UPI0032F12A5B
MSKSQPTRRPKLYKLLCYVGIGLSLTLLKLYLDWTPATAIVPQTDTLTSNTTHVTSPPASLIPPNLPRSLSSRDLENLSPNLSPTRREALNSSPFPTSNNALNLFQQGKTHYQAGQFAAALDAWQQAAAAYQTQGEPLNQAMTLSNLALAHQELAQWNQANHAMAQSFALLDTIPPNTPERLRVQAQALNTQGTLQLAQGQAEAALKTWQHATQLYTQIPDEPGIIRSQINQALALRALGLYRRARHTLEQLETTLQTQPDNPLKAAAYANLGNLLRSLGSPEQAQKTLQKSRDIARTLNSPADISAALLGLGNTARSQEQNELAIDYYQQAAASAISPNAQFEASVNQLDLLLETNQKQPATTLIPQLQELAQHLPTTRPAIYAQIHFAQTLTHHQSQLNPSLSAPEIAQILAHAQQQAQHLKDTVAESYALGYLGHLYETAQQWQDAERLTRQALAQAKIPPEVAYQWQWQLGRLLKAQNKPQVATNAYTSAYKTLKLLRGDLVAANPDIKFTFRDEVEPVYRELVDLLLSPQGTSKPNQENLEQARDVMEALQVAELENFFQSACLDSTVPVDQVVDEKDPTAAIIYPIVLKDRIEVILKLPGKKTPLVHYRSPDVSRQNVEATVKLFRRDLQEPFAYFDKEYGQTLYNWLIKPARPYLERHGIKTLIFVLDEPLRNIPMAALYDGETYLVQTYATALVLGLEVRDSHRLERNQMDVLAVSLTEPPPKEGNFATLDNANRELNKIKAAGIPVAFIRDKNFTKTALEQRLERSTFDIVHLATHGQFGEKPEDTFILAADGKIPLDQFSQLFRRQQSTTTQGIELLLLSACRTATGSNRAVLGIAGAAIQAGTQSAIASLWSLDDQSSVTFTEAFYQHLGQPGVSRAEALQLAQQAMLQNADYQAPLFWAAYVLVGSWF